MKDIYNNLVNKLRNGVCFDMKKELEIIKENLEATLKGFKDAYETEGYDLANEKHYVETALNHLLKITKEVKRIPDFTNRLLTIDESVTILENVLSKCTTFDSDSEKMDFILDLVDAYKQNLNDC